jgi:hypothetical protein
MSSAPDNPAFWYVRAAEARAAASQMADQLARTATLALAARYERLADRIARGRNIFWDHPHDELPVEKSSPIKT